MTRIALFAGVAGILLLGACSNADLIKQVELTKPAGTKFDSSLHANYVKLAKIEENEGDLRDAKHFIMKAKAAAAGQQVAPDGLPPRKVTGVVVTDSSAKDLAGARSRLVKALAGPNVKKMPNVAAEAQTSFDCWVQEAEEGIQANDIAACREVFEIAMAKFGKKRKVASGSPFTVHFKFDSTNLTEESEGALYDIMQKVRVNKPKKVHIIAYTDLSGKNPYNDKLAEMRAQDLAEKIKGAGAKVITTSAPGPKDPIVDTRKPNQVNRRAIIIFAK